MSQCHAASKATRAAVGTTKQSTTSSSSSSRNRIELNSRNSDVKFAQDFVRAALHGHSPLWHYRGWRSSGSQLSKDPKVNPNNYLRRKLIEGVVDDASASNLPRKFRRQQAKLEPFKRYIRPFSTSAAASSRSYGFNVEGPEEEDFEQEDPSDDADGTPSLSVLAAKRQLRPGDWVQMRIFNQSSGAIYLAEDKVNATRGGRRFLVHGFGNILHSVRQEDILFTIPGVVPVNIAKRATRILGLSPQEFIEHLEEEGEPSGENTPPSEIILDDQALWNHYGIEHDAEGWKAVFSAKSQCVAALRDMKLKQEKARAAIAARGPRSLYEHFVQEKDVHITTLQAYSTLFNEKGVINIEDPDSTGERHRHYLLALHDALMDDPEHFVLHSFGTLLNSEFRVRPKEELERLREVRDWVRRHTKEIQQFCDKAPRKKGIIERQRQHIIDSLASSNTGEPAPESISAKSSSQLHWTPSDVKIIKFLENSLDMRRKLQTNPFESAASLLLRRALSTNVEAQDKAAQLHDISPTVQARQATINFLKSIGVYEDWENLTLRDREANLSERMKLLSSYKPKGSTAEPEENVDGLDSQRHDFGKLPVYVIDDLGASELDDGISIEACRSSAENPDTEAYWVHIHIADPTSSLTPTSDLAKQARSFATAVYLPEFVSPMFPDAALKHYKWSLDHDEAESKGQRVLTFSAKVDLAGNVLEKLVRPGTVNKVFTTTYNSVNEMLQRDKPHLWARPATGPVFTWPTESPPPAQKETRRLTALPRSAKSDFETLHKISRALLKQRVKSGHITWRRGTSETSLALGPRPFFAALETDFSLQDDTPRQPPHLTFTLPGAPSEEDSNVNTESLSANMVAEFMILAGRISASHLASRDVPALYRAQDEPSASSPRELQEFLQSRDPETGLTSFEMQLEKGIVFLPAYFSAKPSDHWTMGIKGSSGGYTQATSPLRRFNDMIIHWQLKSILKQDGGDSKARKKPAFSYSDLEEHIKQYTPFDRLLKKLDQRSRNFWKLFVLRQKLAQLRSNPQADPQAAELLFNGLSGKVITHKLDYASLKTVVRLIIPELGGMMATLILDPKFEDIHVGRRFKVEIADIILDDYSRMFVRLRE
ncbi:RNB-domain-containing protein [Cystobasidium minutum MCA 4210]|uniref:RNB-domain-containing protein n=1 Tax=Cystobasidium minutum MCA 4210 TaxID=1397322 RepID=UPI0034CEBBE4|eukprot:jgi/Rhomi1/112259/CE112258_426